MKDMIKYFPETYILYNQIDTFDDRPEDVILKEIKPDMNKMRILNYYFCEILILNLENFITLKKYLTEADHISWVLAFYYQSQSKIFRDVVKRVRDFFSPNTIRVIDEYIKIGDSIKDKNLSQVELIKLLTKVKLNSE
jgi:hypothetical protein